MENFQQVKSMFFDLVSGQRDGVKCQIPFDGILIAASSFVLLDENELEKLLICLCLSHSVKLLLPYFDVSEKSMTTFNFVDVQPVLYWT